MRIVEKGLFYWPIPGKDGEIMATSKAQQKAQNKWIAKAYDRINLTVPKGKKEEIQSFAANTGESVNGFINRAIGEAMGEAPETPQNARQGPGDILTPSALKTAQDAAEKAGETVPAFVERAVETQAKRDKVALAIRPKEKAPDESGT